MRAVIVLLSAIVIAGCKQGGQFTDAQDAAYARVFSENMQRSCVATATSGSDAIPSKAATEMCRCVADNILASYPVPQIRQFELRPQDYQAELKPHFERCTHRGASSEIAPEIVDPFKQAAMDMPLTEAEWNTAINAWQARNATFLADPARRDAMDAAVQELDSSSPGLSDAELIRRAEALAFARTGWR